VTVNVADLPRHVSVTVGGRVEIPLPSYAGSGNTWTALCSRGEEVADVLVELGESPAPPTPSADGTAEPPLLALTPETAVVRGRSPGEATWQLVLSRPFGPSTTAATHELQVTVEAEVEGAGRSSG